MPLICGILMVLVALILIDSVRIWTGILRGTRERAGVRKRRSCCRKLRAEEL